jgi:hypothetical protein
VTAECYRPNAERGNLDRIGFDVGPTLAAWLAGEDPATLARIIAADYGQNAVAQGFHHAILPLATARDRATEIRWGLRDFAFRFGRPAAVMWLPETAADRPTLRELARQGVRATILAPWQAATPGLETRSLHRVKLGGGLEIIVAFYDGTLSGVVSFQPDATADADRFAREHVLPVLAAPFRRDGSARRGTGVPIVLLATDGELYGHHQPWRDLFLAHLADPEEDRGFDVVSLGAVLAAEDPTLLPPARIIDRTSWSCHHGILRWSGECGCAADARWKRPLRAALDRLAAGIDALTEVLARDLPGRGGAAGEQLALDPWTARDAYVDVVTGATSPAAFAAAELGVGPHRAAARRLLDLMEAQRWRLAMFASDGWYWDDPSRPETRQVLRCAGRAVQIVDRLAGTSLERRLEGDLALFASPARGIDGRSLYREALADVGRLR